MPVPHQFAEVFRRARLIIEIRRHVLQHPQPQIQPDHVHGVRRCRTPACAVPKPFRTTASTSSASGDSLRDDVRRLAHQRHLQPVAQLPGTVFPHHHRRLAATRQQVANFASTTSRRRPVRPGQFPPAASGAADSRSASSTRARDACSRAAIAVMLRPEVLDASTASGAASASMRANSSCFHARSSGPDSTTRSAPRNRSRRNRSSRRAAPAPAPPPRFRPARCRSAFGPAPWPFPVPAPHRSAVRLRRWCEFLPWPASGRSPAPSSRVPTTLAVANLVCVIAVILAARALLAVTQLILESVDFVLARSTRALEQ